MRIVNTREELIELGYKYARPYKITTYCGFEIVSADVSGASRRGCNYAIKIRLSENAPEADKIWYSEPDVDYLGDPDYGLSELVHFRSEPDMLGDPGCYSGAWYSPEVYDSALRAAKSRIDQFRANKN